LDVPDRLLGFGIFGHSDSSLLGSQFSFVSLCQ
jgi:hypothetical protein